MKKIFTLLFSLFLFSSGFSQKADSILIGFGGGFSGTLTVYSFSSSSIKKGKGRPPVNYSSSTPYQKKKFKKISSQASAIYKNRKSFSRPYNTYHFLELYSKGKSVKYTWGDPNFALPADIESFYNQLIFIIDNLTLNQK